eukprot:779643-Rhodomonas_salina.1
MRGLFLDRLRNSAQFKRSPRDKLQCPHTVAPRRAERLGLVHGMHQPQVHITVSGHEAVRDHRFGA